MLAVAQLAGTGAGSAAAFRPSPGGIDFDSDAVPRCDWRAHRGFFRWQRRAGGNAKERIESERRSAVFQGRANGG